MIKNVDKKIRAYALKNSLAYGGKAQLSSVISSLFNEGLEKKDVKNIIPKIQKIMIDIEKLSLDKQKQEYESLSKVTKERKVRQGLPVLPKARKGKVIMRFSPSPSGALHIGHAMTSCISFLYVQKYGGKFFVRIEDTNPENICKEAYQLIKDDSKWLFKNKAQMLIQSERMEIYYKYIKKIINVGKAYVCTCSQERFKKYSEKKQNCPCRKLSVKDNLARWKKMLVKETGSNEGEFFDEGDAVLRFKSSMIHKNPAMRDFPLARINITYHVLQKNKYRVWPLMNLAVAVDDIVQGMTHIIRAKEHIDNAKRQKLIYKSLRKKYPWEAYLGRLHIKGMRLSASQLSRAIMLGEYSGWDDKRLLTIQSLMKQGYKPEAFWKMAEHRGISEVDKIMDKKDFFELLDNFNRK